MGLYIQDNKKKTIRHYNTTPQLEKSIETMLQETKNMVWSETGEGYIVEYKDTDESQKALVEACDSFKKDYKNHLRAAMTDMLTEFDLRLSEYQDADLIRVEYIRQDIQEKINALKGEEDDK